MKKLFLVLFVGVIVGLTVHAQSPKPAAKGIIYGSTTNAKDAISVDELENKMQDNKYEGKIKGKVVEVCQEKGCWMKIEKANGEELMVKFKDYKFFMPKDIVGKEVVLDGEASVKVVSIKQQIHYAEDAGKSKQEISKIKEPKKEMQFVAKGVVVL